MPHIRHDWATALGSDERYGLLLNSSNDFILVYSLSPEGTPANFVEVNELACENLGYERDVLLGRSLLDIQAPEARLEASSIAEALLAQGRLVYESVFVTKGGKHLPVEVSASVLERKNWKGVLAIAREITHQKRNEAAYRLAVDVADAAVRARSEFIASVGHELLTPLSSIIGYAELLLDEVEGPLRPPQRDSLERLRRNATQLRELVDALLDFASSEGGSASVERGAFDPCQRVEELADRYAVPARAKGVEFWVRCADDLPRSLTGDEKRLLQALECLLDNAVKFTDRGSIAVEVAGQPQEGHRYLLHLRVEDTGKGISPEEMKRVFQPFIQADASTTRRHGGVGLGLAIARRAAETLGGRLWAESEMGKGSTFHLSGRFDV